MSNRALCPGCDTETSRVWEKFVNGEPCPNCGLSAAAAEEILAVRARRGEERLRAELEAALTRAGRAEAERDALRARLDRLREAVSDALEVTAS